MPFLTTFLYSQLFVTPQLPNHDFSNQTIIVTGSNTGLGCEAAKHFLALHCATLVIAVRNTSKGESAKKSLLDTLPNVTSSQIQVWPLDLSSSTSVRAFAHRASAELERVDVLVENAGIDAQKFKLSEDGSETTLQTNVISTCLLAVLMLPKMRKTGEKFKTRPHLEIVTSDTHYVAGFKERNAEGKILKALNDEQRFNQSDRYGYHMAPSLFHQFSSTTAPRLAVLTLLLFYIDTRQQSSSRYSTSANSHFASNPPPQPNPRLTPQSSPSPPPACATAPSSVTLHFLPPRSSTPSPRSCTSLDMPCLPSLRGRRK
jgi:NAD(P)-dependent dehydrogenase (short-subunit alcohol dehydrogenase family)